MASQQEYYAPLRRQYTQVQCRCTMLTGATCSAPFSLQGVSFMKKTIAKFATTIGAPVSFVAILALFPVGAQADLVFEHGGHTYKLVELPATWDEATAAAKSTALAGDPGYLARIDSAAENQAILEAVTSHLSPAQLANSIPNDGSEAAFVWLGGSDGAREGQWIWTNNGDLFWRGDFNGAPVNGRFTNWGVQPDNLGGVENALAMGLANWPEPFYDLGEAGNGMIWTPAINWCTSSSTTPWWSPDRLIWISPLIKECIAAWE